MIDFTDSQLPPEELQHYIDAQDEALALEELQRRQERERARQCRFRAGMI